MKITITKDEQEFDQAAAWRIIGQLLEKPNAVIGLSTGQTTIGMHRVVSEIYAQYPFLRQRRCFLSDAWPNAAEPICRCWVSA